MEYQQHESELSYVAQKFFCAEAQRLLSPLHDPLTTLSLYRLQLDWSKPYAEILLRQGELVCYPLIGTVEAGISTQAGFYGISWLGGRRKLPGTSVPVLRCIASPEHTGIVALRVVLREQQSSTDMLLLHTTQLADAWPYTGMLVQHRPHEHAVGDGTHARTVREYDTPPGFLLHVGETINIPGGWSSYPAHADEQAIQDLLHDRVTHEEVFFCVCDTPAEVFLWGHYANKEAVNKHLTVLNGNALVMPLGRHSIVAGPGGSLTYIWGYVGNALKKQYNKAADDLNVYVQ